MRYYGGREISEEDLERAFLVGMSPHERRRLKRKKGSSFKHAKGSSIPDLEQETSTSSATTPIMLDTSAVNISNGLDAKEECEFSMVKDVDMDHTSSYSDLGTDGKAPTIVEKSLTSGRCGLSDANKVSSVNGGDDCENRSPQNRQVDYFCTKNHGISHPKHKSKLSLLGHGPHGKQVVDYLLETDGDEGIRQFCQRWRQVFVEAIHPRFLPSGWDIMHRYSNHDDICSGN